MYVFWRWMGRGLIHGFPQRFARGFQLIKIDPTTVYIRYKTAADYNYLVKKYSDNIDEFIREDDE